MEVGRLPGLFAGAGGYVHKTSFQGNDDGALVHAPRANAVSCLILHPFLTMLIQPCSTASLPGAIPPPTTCPYNAFHIACHPSYYSSMFHIKLPLTHLPCPTHRGFCGISLLIYFLIFSLGTCSLVTWDQFLEINGSKLPYFSHP